VISVIVPAYNEAAVIGRLLGSLLADARPGEFDIVVVANGCTDNTAEVAAGFGEAVTVLSTPVPSKFAALGLGDEKAAGFPRLYVDADVEIDTATARALAAALQEPGVLAVAPERDLVLDGRPLSVRWYYEFWERLPVVRDGLFGRGVIGLSAAGKELLVSVSDAMADDLAASVSFAPTQRRVVAGARARIYPPRTRQDLVSRRIRSVVSTEQLAQLTPAGGSARTRRSDLLGVVRERPSMALRLPVFLAVTLLGRRSVRQRLAAEDFQTWDRDESSRA
jgi:Glycosyl transferase family 2